MAPTSDALDVAAAYTRWAPVYDRENALTTLDELAAGALSPPRWTRLLDAGCGTARRLPATGFSVGIDLVRAMLVAGAGRGRRVNAALERLPFGPELFDLIWCRLAIGHVATLTPAYAELSRVAAGGGRLVVTDLHPAAARDGGRRTFVDIDGVSHAVMHHVHDVADHASAAGDAGWMLERTLDLVVDERVKPYYDAAGALERYAGHYGRPLLLALEFRRDGG